MASWTTPDLSRLPRRPLDLPDVRSGGRRGPRAALRHRRGVAPSGQGLRRRLGAGAPSARCGRRRHPPRPRARRAGRVREARQRARWSTMLWRMTARVPGDAEKRPRGNPATRVRLVRKSGTTSVIGDDRPRDFQRTGGRPPRRRRAVYLLATISPERFQLNHAPLRNGTQAPAAKPVTVSVVTGNPIST